MIELLSIPAIILAVEAVKKTGLLPSKYSALLALVFGLAFGLGLGDWVSGLIYGLSASGIYSGAKALLK